MKIKTNKAFTIIETLVAMVITMIALGAMYFAYQYFNNSYKSIVDRAVLSENGRNSLSLIAKDLRNAGYKNQNYQGTWDRDKKIEVKNNSDQGGDRLNIWYDTDQSTRIKAEYYISKIGDDFNLVKQLYENGKESYCERYSSSKNCLPINIVEHVSDFQVVLRDKNGSEITSVNESNQNNVHTAEIYVTVRSTNEIYKTDKVTRIINNFNSTTGREENLEKDKFHRETFFLSVHLRNLGKI